MSRSSTIQEVVLRSAAIHALDRLKSQPLCGAETQGPWNWTTLGNTVTCIACRRRLRNQGLATTTASFEPSQRAASLAVEMNTKPPPAPVWEGAASGQGSG
jgi:hypothetical protein